MLRRTAQAQVLGRGHAQAPVLGQAHADQRGVGQIAHPHRAVEPLGGQVDHAVAQIERDRDIGMQLAIARHQRRHVAPPETGRRGDAQVAAGLHAARRYAGLGVRELHQQALAVFQESAALVRERDAPRGAHQQLDAEPLLQRIEPAPHDGRRHALGLGRGRQAAPRRHRHKGFHGLELVHRARLCARKSQINHCAAPAQPFFSDTTAKSIAGPRLRCASVHAHGTSEPVRAAPPCQCATPESRTGRIRRKKSSANYRIK